MSVLNSMMTVLIALGVAVAMGQILFNQAGSGAPTLYSAFGTITGTFWFLGGFFMLLGGFIVGGMLAIAIGFYLARGNYARYKQERGQSLRARIANGK